MQKEKFDRRRVARLPRLRVLIAEMEKLPVLIIVQRQRYVFDAESVFVQTRQNGRFDLLEEVNDQQVVGDRMQHADVHLIDVAILREVAKEPEQFQQTCVEFRVELNEFREVKTS